MEFRGGLIVVGAPVEAPNGHNQINVAVVVPSTRVSMDRDPFETVVTQKLLPSIAFKLIGQLVGMTEIADIFKSVTSTIGPRDEPRLSPHLH
jgi:hypothetical protein